MSNLPSSSAPSVSTREDFSEYVAQLQLHMALQARNLTPSTHGQAPSNQRQSMLHQTQANIEKMVSRQAF